MPSLKAAILPVTPLQQNCTLMYDEETMKGVVFDPGGDIARVQEVIGEIGFEVEKILLTHGHIDHAGGAAELKEKLGVEIEGPHEADRFLLESLEETGAEYGITDARNVTPDRWLDEGDSVTVGPFTFAVRHCPGHAPGHVVFIQEELRLAQVGDVLFKGSIGRTDFPYGDHEALIEAIKTKLLPLGDDMAFICGHGAPSTIGEERQSNPFIQ
ncbi:MAG: MBL fold metallo-hydrolase [Hyphomicrobiales bacterium]|nr:MBL fold metallo-hydrolase [Hyphomicrobiales bacterium]